MSLFFEFFDSQKTLKLNVSGTKATLKSFGIQISPPEFKGFDLICHKLVFMIKHDCLYFRPPKSFLDHWIAKKIKNFEKNTLNEFQIQYVS